MAETEQTVIAPSDLPGLFQAADTASTNAQRRYLQLVAADLSVMIAGAIFGAVSVADVGSAQSLAFASATAIAVGLVLMLALQAQKLSATWYDGRAVAETTKTSAWRYMMRAHPYGGEESDAAADRALSSAFAGFLRDRRGLAGSLAAALAERPQITATMRAVRAMSIARRKEIYMKFRLTDQRSWYAARAEHNARQARFLYALVVACHALALGAAIARVRWPSTQLNMTGVFAALASALIAWTQLKKHEEQANVYGLTAQELRSLEEQARYAVSEDDFSRFVEESEGAITRENAIWLARREKH